MMGMPQCREVARAIAADQLVDAPFRRRAAVRLHLLLCSHCRRYAGQIRAIGVAARDVFSRPAGQQARLARLRRVLLARLGQ
jgi:hypothetical protein